MRKLLTGLMMVCLLTVLGACGSSDSDDVTEWTVLQMAESIWDSQDSSAEAAVILPGDELYETYLADNYGLDEAEVADGAILAAGGILADEVAVLRLTQEASAQDVEESLATYLENRSASFTGYFPEQAALLENAEIAIRGSYVALMVGEDMTAAGEAFDACFTQEPPQEDLQTTDRTEGDSLTEEETEAQSGEGETSGAVLTSEPEESTQPAQETLAPEETLDPQETLDSQETVDSEETLAPEEIMSPQETLDPEETIVPEETQASETEAPQTTEAAQESQSGQTDPPEQEDSWSYQEERLLNAWNLGDWSDLSAEDQAILDVCAEVIASVAPDGLSDYEKELAIHDWMIARGDYDSDTLSQLPVFEEDPNNDNPYGFLINGRGICLGYATTFQLFMDLLGIECITVEGSAYNYTADHAWNQVFLDGEWYCVDVTWDDPISSGRIPEQTAHRYFNVTSEFMRQTTHQWDEEGVPEAEGTEYAWRQAAD